jgi:type VI protein secretion system component VasF
MPDSNNGTVVAPDTLVSDIDATRADLARTIDTIADRVSPKKAARRTMDRVRERVSQIDPVVSGAAVAVVVGVTALVVWRRIRR